MGCACKLPAEKYPETADWGPLFWKILHALAELAGKQSSTILQGDEVRIWIQVLTTLHPTIPCDICRDHYARWIYEHPPATLSILPYMQVGAWIRNYLWELHNTINEGNEKPIFPKEDLAAAYKDVSITASWRALEPVMKRAITLNGITLLPWKKWLGFVRMLQGVYGVT
jgi:hypothetical protein